MNPIHLLTSCLAVVVCVETMDGQSQPASRRIVLSTPKVASQGAVLKIDERAKLEIGGRADTGATVFDHIIGVVRQSTGKIVVANGGSGELRIFDSLGRHIRTVGRLGAGPGEFRQLFALFLGPGDSLIAYDVVQGFQVFDPLGGYHRTTSYGRSTSTPLHLWPYGWFEDGYQLAGGMRSRDRFGTGRSVDSMVFYHVNPRGEDPTELLRYPAFELASISGGPRLPVVFSAGIVAAVWANRFCVGYGLKYEILCIDLIQKTSTILRLDVPQKTVPSEAIERYRTLVRLESFQGGSFVPPPIRARRENLLRITTFAHTQPAYAQFVAASTGELWVRRYDIEADIPIVDPLQERSKKPTEWDIFSSSGKWLTTVQLPGRFRVWQVSADYVLGVRVDDDDVERVALLSLRR
jgi:hypothetical protein